jgi:hypothetical protein
MCLGVGALRVGLEKRRQDAGATSLFLPLFSPLFIGSGLSVKAARGRRAPYGCGLVVPKWDARGHTPCFYGSAQVVWIEGIPGATFLRVWKLLMGRHLRICVNAVFG